MAIGGNQFFNGGIYGPPEGQGCDFFGDGSGKLLFRFDNTITDTCGNYLNNPIYTDEIYSADSKFGATSFGPRGYIVSNNTNGLLQGTLSARSSCSMWVKFPSVPTNAQSLLTIEDWKIFFNSGGVISMMYGIGTGNSQFSPRSVSHNFSINDWHHISMVVGGYSNYKLYLDNVLRIDYNNSNPPREPYKLPFSIGANNFSSQNFTGQIDQLRVFNRTLSASEVTALYNES